MTDVVIFYSKKKVKALIKPEKFKSHIHTKNPIMG